MINLGDEQTITPPTSDTQAELSRVSSERNLRANHLNFIKGRNSPSAFLPLSPKIGGLVNNS